MRRMGFGHCAHGCIDFIEASIFAAPEYCAPGDVKLIDSFVTRLQPASKALHRSSGIAHYRMMAAVFVVGLPGGDSRMRAIAFGQQRDNALRFTEIRR